MSARSVLEFSPGAAGPLLAGDPLWWQDLAECQYTDSEIFFPEKGGSVRAAKRVCAGCVVRAECLEYALANEEKFGVWAGTSEAQRRRILASRRAGPAPLCKAGLHPMAGTNIIALGECLACRKDREARQRLATAA